MQPHPSDADSFIPSNQLWDRDGVIWFDGDLVPWRKAQLHVLSHGLHYASSVFEGERAYSGRIFRLRDHTRRLQRSATIMGFDLPFSEHEINAACRQAIAENDIVDGYLRPIAWRGAEALGVSAENRVHIAIAAWPWPSYFDAARANAGVRLQLSRWQRPHPSTAPVFAKTASVYAIGTLAKEAAESAGYDDALMLDWRGNVAEASGANVFFVDASGLHTPKPDCFLDGLTRRSVMALATQAGIPVRERIIEPSEIAAFEECFLTGSAAELVPVASVGDHEFVTTNTTRQLSLAFGELVNGSATQLAH